MRSRSRIEVIQALRGVAACLVVLFHLKWTISGPHWMDLGDRLFRNGFCGVDLFFMISGFIMVQTAPDRASSPRDAVRFLARRWARIWPVYMVAMAVFLVIAHDEFLVSSHAFQPALKAAVFYPISRVGAPVFGFPPVFVGWSLVHEILFYLLFAVALASGRWRWQVLAALFAVCLIGVPLALRGHVWFNAYHDYVFHPAILDVATSPMMWEFAVGVGVGLIYRSPRWHLPARVWRSVALVAIGAAVYQFSSDIWSGYGLTKSGFTIAPAFAAIMLLDREQPIVPPRWLTWLGDVSFSLYLWHLIMIRGAITVLDGIGRTNLCTGGSFFLLVIGLTIVGAHLSYRYLERGLAERVRRALRA